MSDALKKFDDETRGILEEFKGELESDFIAKMEESQEEVAKFKEGLSKIGLNLDKMSVEDISFIKNYKENQNIAKEGTRESRLKALGGMIGAFAGAKGSIQVAKEQISVWKSVAKSAEDKLFAEEVEKAINTTTFQGGGAVIPTVYSNEFVMALRDQSFKDRLGMRRVNFQGGQYIIGKHNAGVTGAYVGETKKIGKDQPKFGDIVLTPKKAGVIVPIANEWLRNSDTGAFENVTRDAILAMDELMGSTLLEGAGTQHTPKGLSKLANSSNITSTAGTTNAQIITDLLYGRKQLSTNKIALRKPAAIMNPAQEIKLMSLRDDVGGFIFRDEMVTGKLFGVPYFSTTAVEVASSKSKLYFADFDYIYEASNRNLEMNQSDSATFTNSDGDSVNAFEQDMSLMRLVYSHDFGTQYDRAIAIVTNIAWGN